MKNKFILLLTCGLTLSLCLNIYLWPSSNIDSSNVDSTNATSANVNNNQVTSTNLERIDSISSANNSITTSISSSNTNNQSISKEKFSNSHIAPSATNQDLNLLVAKAEQFFYAYQFNEALDYFQQIQRIDELKSLQLKGNWLASNYQWLDQNQFTLLSNFLNNYLAQFPFDEDVLLLKIEWFKKTNQIPETIEIYQELVRHAFDLEKEKVWIEQIHRLANQQLMLLKKQQEWQKIIHFLDPLLYEETNYPPYILAITEAYLRLNERSTASNYLENIRYNKDYENQIDILYQLLNEEKNGVETIALTKINEHFIVDAYIDGQQNSRLMIDTGASLTVVSNAYYENLLNTTSVEQGRSMTINTAGGDKQAFSIIVAEFSVGNYLVEDFEIVVMDLDNFEKADGLLGMNFLKNFKFEIDQTNSTLLLSLPQ
ncbi:TIGR02281 family clan AA aspartic protease [Colwelliaceae bacterium BS250]